MEDEARQMRNDLFQELKPKCIHLSQLALKHESSPQGIQTLKASTAELLDVLRERCRGNLAFDNKLADYVFFPLSHVLRSCQTAPGRLAELAIQCVEILLRDGWQRAVPLDVATQLMLLMTFFAGGAGVLTPVVSEELKTAVYGSLGALFQAIRSTPKGPATLTETSNVPALGQCLTTILDGITDGPTIECQMRALEALQELWVCVRDQQALATFLPGTVSALTKTLSLTTRNPRSRKILIAGMFVMQKVLTICLGDFRTRNLPDQVPESTDSKTTMLTKSWLQATGVKIKMALSNIVKLRNFDDCEVRSALGAMCLVLLDECHSSLVDAAPLLVETAMFVADSNDEDSKTSRTSLKDLAILYDSIADLVKNTAYNWIATFPRIMQSNDEEAKRAAIKRLSTAYNLVNELGMASTILEEAINDSIQNGVSSIIELSSVKSMVQEAAPLNFETIMVLSNIHPAKAEFSSVVMPHEGHAHTRTQILHLLQNLGSPEAQLRMAYSMTCRLQAGGVIEQLSSFWLAFQLLKSSSILSKEFDVFLTEDVTEFDEKNRIMEELYNYSLAVISEEDEVDWRLQAIGLEVIAYQAQEMQEHFQSDLIDVLYPTVQLLGSSNQALREHAIVSLNAISSFSGYSSTSDLIVKNVDYLVNAISLKLNTFDVSPQAPQVLVMMIKLAGQSLLPYLDDVVGSIFAALDNFHGYPRLVETLFSVLGEIVQEGTKSAQLRLTSSNEPEHQKTTPHGPSIEDTVRVLRKKILKRIDSEVSPHEDVPQKPWKMAKELLDEKENAEEIEDEADMPKDMEKLPPSKIYTMVQRIARLSQHYLTTQSPLFRHRLLELMSIAFAALYGNEDEFLPLVNDVWPVLIKRLYDEEPYVVIAASATIVEVCKGAGDFMSTRIHTEWIDLMRLFRQGKSKALAERQGKHARGIYAKNWQVWEGFISLIVTILKYVRIGAEMFDELLELVGDSLSRRVDARDAFAIVNADALWLEQTVREIGIQPKPPLLKGFQFAGW